MIESFLIIIGVIFAVWLYALVRQTQRGFSSAEQMTAPRPVVPVNLADSDEAVIMAEGRGRIVYANDPARKWFGIDGGAPNLTLMAQMVQPADTLYELLAASGHATFRVGPRQVEAVSHTIPDPGGSRMMVVMRELTGGVTQVYTDYDPLRALAILDDISRATGTTLDLSTTVEAIIRSLTPTISFDTAEITLWYEETQTLRPVAYNVVRTTAGNVVPPESHPDFAYRVGEGYTGWLAAYRQPLLINDVAGRVDVFPKAFRGDFQSYLGVPLIVGDQFVGTLELTHRNRAAFDQQDLSLLQTVSGQIASAVQAARLYRDQRARVAELDGLQQISEAMSQLGEMSSLYAQLTLRIANLMDVNLCGILIYDDTEQMFRSQPPFYGAPDSLIAHYRLKVVPGTELYSIWHHQPWWYTNDPTSPLIHAMGFEDLTSAVTIEAMALVPMIIGTRRVGLLMVANRRTSQPFTEDDMRSLMAYASQAAVVAENARLYDEEQRRTRELGGLQQIAQAIGSLRSPIELYSQITARIANLMDVQMCGILLYDPRDRVLVSQRPFFGMDDEEAIKFYQLRSPPGSAVARLWQDRSTWFSNNLRTDPSAQDTDLAALAMEIGVNKTVIATLSASGTRLGIIQASNKLDNSDFTEDDARLLFIFAGQAAILIENARLYREMLSRTHEAEGLRAVTEIVSQAAPDDETIEQVLIAVSNLLEAGVVMISLVDDTSGALVLTPGYVFGGTLANPFRVDAYAPGFADSVLITRRPLVSGDLRSDQKVLPMYRPLIEQLALRDGIFAPLIIHDRSIGELVVANRTTGQEFTTSDTQLLMAIGTQVAAMVDRMRLYQATDHDLRARVQELNALSRVSHELSQTLELDRILDVIRQEALRSTEASAASIVLLDDRSDWPTPDEPVIEQRFGEGRALRSLAPIERAAILRNDVLTVNEYQNSEFEAAPPKTRSALAVPVMYGEYVTGVIHLFSPAPGVFSTRAVDFALALTDHATVAIANARRYREQLRLNERLRVRAERMGRIFELGEMFRQGASLPEMLEEVAHSIQETVGFNVVLISLLDERTNTLRRTAQAGLPLTAFAEMQQVTPPLEQAQNLMQELYRISHSYFLPSERSEGLRADLPVYKVLEERMGEGPRAWDANDLLVVPLYGSDRRLLGLVSVDEPQSGRRPDVSTIEALEIFANQAAFAIENYRLIQRIREEAAATRRERDRLAQLHLVANEIQSAPDVPSRLQVVAGGIHEAGWGHVVITLHDEHLEPTALIQAGYTPDEAMLLSDTVVSGETWRAWINDLGFHDLKLGGGYYLRYDHPWVREHVHKGRDLVPASVDAELWHPMDVLYLPLVGQDQKRIIGMMAMDDPVEGLAPTEASLKPFELFASQAAAAIETTRLYMETVRAAEQEQRLNEVMEAVSGAISSEGVIQAIGRGLQQMVPFTRMSLALYDEAQQHFNILRAEIALDSSVSVYPSDPLPFDGTAIGVAYREAEAELYRLGQESAPRENFADLKAWYHTGERSTLLVPMIAGGQPVGVLRMGSELENAFGFLENLDLIQRLANLSAVALENARLFTQARERASQLDAQARRLALINRIATRLSRALLSEEIHAIALNEMQEALGAQYGGVVMYESDEEGRLVLDSHPTRGGRRTEARIKLVNNRSIAVLRDTLKPVVSPDMQTDPRFEAVRKVLASRGTAALLLVPLIIGGKVIGSIELDFTATREFSESELELAETIASQVSVALEKTMLLGEAERRAAELDAQARRLAALNRMSSRLAQTLVTDEIYHIVLEEMQAALGIEYGGLMLIQDDHTSKLVVSTHPMDDPLPDLSIPVLGNPIAEYVIETHKPYISEDLFNDPRFEFMWDIQRARDTAAMLIVPVIMGGQVTGTIGLDSAKPRRFTEPEIELALTAANQAAVAIEKARLFSETQQRAVEMDAQARRLSFINRVSAQLAQTLDSQEIYRIVLNELQAMLSVAYGGMVVFENEEFGRLVYDTHPSFGGEGTALLPLNGNPSIEQIIRTHKPLVSEDAQHDPLLEPAWDLFRERGTVSLMIVPLMVGESVIGTIGLDATERRDFTDVEIEVAGTVAGQASLAVEKARLYDETLGLTIFNQAVVESIQQGIVVLDRDLTIRRVNRYMVDRYNWSTSAVSRSLFDYRPDYAGFLREPVAVVLALGEPQVRYEVERRDEAGAPSIRNYYLYPMREGSSVTGIVLLLEDVTERARLEADLNTRAVQMAALSEVSSRITSTLEPDQVIDVVLDALNRVVPYDGVSLWLRSTAREELYIAAARGYETPDATAVNELVGLTVEIAYSPLFREMADKARVINARDVAEDPRFPYGSEAIFKNWLGAPLISKGEIMGVLALEKREPNYYGVLHEQLALTFANQAAVALDNARLFQETRARASALDQQAQRLALLNRVSLALAQTLDLENIFEIALREVAIALEAIEGSAMQVDRENRVCTVIVEYPRGDEPPEASYHLGRIEALERVVENLIPLVVDYTEDNPVAASMRPVLRRHDVHQSLLVPMVVGGDVIGLLRLDSTGPGRSFTSDQIELAQTITSQAATAVQNAGLFEQGQIRTRELETLFESAQATAVTLDLNEVMRRVAIQMLAAVGADACAVFLWDDVNDLLDVRGEISARPQGALLQVGDVFSLADFPLRERALRNRELLILSADDPDLPPGEHEVMQSHAANSRMLIPLVVNEISIGLVELETLDGSRHFKGETVRLARTLASQAAISIENARLQTETRRTVEELYIINDMSGQLSSATSLDELLTVIDAQLPSLTEAQVMYVAIYDEETQQISFPLATVVRDDSPLEVPACRLGKDEFSLIIRQKAPLLLAGSRLDQVRRSLGIETIMPGAMCFLGVPLFAGDDVVGVLAIRDDDDSLAFTHNDQRILNTVGAQLGVSIQSTRLFQQTLQLAEELDQRVRDRTAELEQERQHISTLYAITTELATSLDMDRLLNRSLEMVASAVGANQGAILAIDPILDRLIFRARFGLPPLTSGNGDGEDLSLSLNEGLAGWAILNRRGVVVDNVQEDPRWLRLSALDDVPCAAMVSLIESSEDVLGVMMLYSDKPGSFHEDHLRLVTAAASQVANAMNNAELYSLIRDQAERLGAMLREQQVEATKSGAILDSVADGVMVSDPAGKVILFNTAASAILKLAPQQVINHPIAQIVGLYGGGHSRWADMAERWMTDPAAYQPGVFLEERITLEDLAVISVRLSPVHMGDQFLGTVSIFRDITREVEVDRLKSEFVATVSHELRTPMTSIKGYADLLLLGAAGDISDQQQRFLETIKQNADRLSILVNDLLDISRIDQGRMELRFTTVEVKDLLNAAAAHVQGRIEDEKRPMNIEVQIADGQHLTVWGDYDKVAQILTNLSDNAYNYTPTGGTITLSARPGDDDNHVVLQVADTGVGIPADVGDRVFERFFRGDELHELVMDTPGTGLGLSIVRELVTVHRGRIWYDSEMGQGTTFYVELPSRPDDTGSGSEHNL